MKDIENPYVYPFDETVDVKNGETLTKHHLGLQLRDYLAAKAMQGYLSDPNIIVTADGVETISRVAYKVADAMLKQRMEP